MNIVENLAKIFAVSIIFISLYFIVWFSTAPIIPTNTPIALKSSGSRDLDAEKMRMNALNEMVRQNSHELPPRTSNKSARDLCSMKNMCTPRNRQYQTQLRVSPKYKMVSCVVQKSMSTMISGTMCYLYDEEGFINSGRDFDDELQTRFCRDKNEYFDVATVRSMYNISLVGNDWSFSMITRDPIDRFVSGYVDRCIRIRQPNGTIQCNGCRWNLTCFVETEYKRMMEISNRGKVRRTMEDAHFFPQLWHCDLHTELEYFEFLKYSTNAEDLLIPQFDDLMERQKVPLASRQFIHRQLLFRRPNHATISTTARRFYYSRLMSSPYLLEFIIKMFYYDFVQFHYALPNGF
ncbi:unnamed protein product [Caenorhabditis angaria]|uniref:Uncharacterized protein n=1 Tax=Caenorhabditis angaria TaxID=860376 RepID=A0A9P1J4F9_9PELO|nr:unnamed protein product [Caenorhabditis angaria]